MDGAIQSSKSIVNICESEPQLFCALTDIVLIPGARISEKFKSSFVKEAAHKFTGLPFSLTLILFLVISVPVI